ncbi:hypothetical protein STAS_18158 [Striga asiatica]|uniref:Uncharacterized protein n=1 Tax=Striga asiatica TaxID=4170 RepID=A0A5A7Q8C2_STRAF|nr:hypothetical protein STAS_18158 [Striga asiatica]
MNFLLRNNQNSAQQLPPVKETHAATNYVSKPATTLGGLIYEEPFTGTTPPVTHDVEGDEFGDMNNKIAVPDENNGSQVDSHIDVTEDAGLIIIPSKEIPDNWFGAPDIFSFRSLDRNFVFPGEQIGILACLSAYKQDTEIITPFKVAAVMNKNGIGESSKKQNGNIEGETSPGTQSLRAGSEDQDNQHGEHVMEGNTDSHKDASAGESLLRMEDHRRQTEQLLHRFENSHFFVRVAESDEPLWSKRRAQESFLKSSTAFEEQLNEESSETPTTTRMKNSLSVSIDRGHFDARTSGGLARGAVKCRALSNGDIVVLLHVNVGVHFVKDPVLEILQFEKYEKTKPALVKQDIPTALNQDPYGELLKWLLPLENSVLPPPRPLSPPTLSTSSSIRSTSSKPIVSGSSGSQLFSFGHFRSYSMSSLPPNLSPPPAMPPSTTKPAFDPEDWNQFSFKQFVESGKSGKEGLLSFRGVPLRQERFSVRCGLEGIFTPGRRWKRKVELIQPVEIRSFSVDCNSDDLLCVHVKNVSPSHVPDMVVYIDAITIIFEEAAQGGPPLFLPIACIESGNGYCLPNLALRRGEEHSFILKPATTLWRHSKGQNDSDPRPSGLPAGNASSNWQNLSNIESKHGGSLTDQYAVLVSCRCNYTVSKLFFKQRTSWRPRISRDLMISVASEMSTQTLGSDGTKLPVQVLTLQASNMTPDNLTLTVLAPASFTSPSVVPLSGSPTTTLGTFSPSAGLIERVNTDMQGQNVEDGPVSEAPNSDLGCTHLWLQSRVPLGCVPSKSMATVKLEVLPLTDGIITLDSLQIEVKEKGLTYIPEQSLKINATSSIATGVL